MSGINDDQTTIPDMNKQTFYFTANSMVQIPEGPFNPTNYSGTQMNFWGVAPNNVPGQGLGGSGGYSLPYGSTPSQLGYMTNNMLRVSMSVQLVDSVF